MRKMGSCPCVHRVGSLWPDTAQRLRVTGTGVRFHMEHTLTLALKCLTSQITPGFTAISLCNDGSPLCLQVESFSNHSSLPTPPKTALYTGVPSDLSQRPLVTFYARPPPPGSHADSMVLNVKVNRTKILGARIKKQRKQQRPSPGTGWLRASGLDYGAAAKCNS